MNSEHVTLIYQILSSGRIVSCLARFDLPSLINEMIVLGSSKSWIRPDLMHPHRTRRTLRQADLLQRHGRVWTNCFVGGIRARKCGPGPCDSNIRDFTTEAAHDCPKLRYIRPRIILNLPRPEFIPISTCLNRTLSVSNHRP